MHKFIILRAKKTNATFSGTYTPVTTVPLKSKLHVPPSREMHLVSRECTGSTNTSQSSMFKTVLCITVSYRFAH